MIMIKNITLTTMPTPVNRLYTVTRGRKILSKEARRNKEVASWELKSLWEDPPTQNEVVVQMDVYYKQKRKRDVDGPIKFLLDLMTGIVYEDDSQIKRIEVEKHIDGKSPRVEIKILQYQ